MSDKQKEIIEFRVPDWSLCALINNDWEGLSEEDKTNLKEFVDKTFQIYGNADFHLMPEESRNAGFYWANEVDNVGGICETVCIISEKRNS